MLVGLASGTAAAAGYTLHCAEDSPLFYVTWYGIAIALAAIIGAVLEHRFLRW
ncbi:NrsF family protein [Paracoccus pacificus]|uniref:NrsF family protein n=1 Tax=Paracoccus pacificus TaxID=1463598 RepID=A0ABW4R5A3_9RHOB